MVKMKNSGYSINYRTQIPKSALNAFDKMLEDDRNGTRKIKETTGTKMVKRPKQITQVFCLSHPNREVAC